MYAWQDPFRSWRTVLIAEALAAVAGVAVEATMPNRATPAAATAARDAPCAGQASGMFPQILMVVCASAAAGLLSRSTHPNRSSTASHEGMAKQCVRSAQYRWVCCRFG